MSFRHALRLAAFPRSSVYTRKLVLSVIAARFQHRSPHPTQASYNRVLLVNPSHTHIIRDLYVSSRASFCLTNFLSAADPEQDAKMAYAEKSNNDGPVNKMSQAQRMKRAVKEYGATVIVFHTCISLFTLGVSYAAVSSGLDVIGLLAKLGVGQSILESKIATGASTFMIAYAVHKVFAPARMATTLAATPLIVRYLRRIGFIKQPVSKV